MNVLFVSRASSETIDKINSIYKLQAESLEKKGVSVDFFLIHGNGISAYLDSNKQLKKVLRSKKYDIVHAHYGLTGFLTILQKGVKVIVTFHGSDIHNPFVRLISFITAFFADKNIFVSQKLLNKCPSRKSIIIPCGVDLERFFPINKFKARNELNFSQDKNYVLFAGAFNDPIKDYPLAQKLISEFENTQLIEIKKLDYTQVNKYLNAVDLVLLTSKSEGSPQIIKEAMACNCPIVSTDVGDIVKIINGAKLCYVSNKYNDLKKAIFEILNNKHRSDGRMLIEDYSSTKIAERIYSEYKKIG